MDPLQTLSDQELLQRTATVATQERHLTVRLLEHLLEVDRRSLFLDQGYPSLYDYVIKELKFSEGAAYRRIQAMRLLRAVPETGQRLEQGRLNLTTAAKVQKAAQGASQEEKLKLVDELEGKSTRETDRELAKRDPTGPREFTRWLNEDEVQLTFSLERINFAQLQELQSLRTHKDIAKTYKGIVSDLVELGHEKWNPLQRNATSAARSHCVKEGQTWRTVPPSLRRAVWQRDAGVCTYKAAESGKICGSRDLLQIDHIEPLALGGKNELSNLRLLCAAHNRQRAEKTFGPRPDRL